MKIVFAITLALLLASHTTFAEKNTEILERYIKAFNEKDLGTMIDLSAPDMRWMSVSGQNISVETSSHAELRKAMTSYFESTPSARSSVRSIRESGSFVYTVKEAFWSLNGVEKSQCSLAVYELKHQKISNVWYFPEHKCE